MRGVLVSFEPNSLKYWVWYYIFIISYASVDIFAILSGYLNVDKRSLRGSKAVKYLVDISFYCIIITCLFLALKPNAFIGFKEIITKGLFPPLAGGYWYIINYIPLMIVSPFVNKLIDDITFVKITISQPLKLTKSWDKLGQFTKKRAFY